MRKLKDTKPIGHALIWIAIYLVAVNIGDIIEEALGFPGLTGIVLIILSIVLIIYLRVGGKHVLRGVSRAARHTATHALLPSSIRDRIPGVHQRIRART
ncbi:hypothetical protein ACOM2C_19520 [Pseudarthrobacter sp. So.54]